MLLLCLGIIYCYDSMAYAHVFASGNYLIILASLLQKLKFMTLHSMMFQKKCHCLDIIKHAMMLNSKRHYLV